MDKNAFAGNKRKYTVVFGVILGVYFAMKYLSPILSPFILAFLAAGLLNKLREHFPIKIKKTFFAGIVLFFTAAAAAAVIWGIGCFLFHKGSEMAGNSGFYQEEICRFLSDCCERMETRFGVDGDAIEGYVLEQVNIFAENMEVKVLPAIMGKSVSCFKSVAALLGSFAVMVIGIFLIIKDYDKIMKLLRSSSEFKGIWEVAKKVIDYIKTFLKAQLIILSIISTVCALTLGFTGIQGGVVYGVFTGFMDMLPFIGTGIMLLPLALFQLLSGYYGKAVIIVCLYGACALLREFLEPRLIGSRVGIWPVGILFAVFAGVQLFGVWGIIKGPVALVIVSESCKYLLRKKEESAA